MLVDFLKKKVLFALWPWKSHLKVFTFLWFILLDQTKSQVAYFCIFSIIGHHGRATLPGRNLWVGRDAPEIVSFRRRIEIDMSFRWLSFGPSTRTALKVGLLKPYLVSVFIGFFFLYLAWRWLIFWFFVNCGFFLQPYRSDRLIIANEKSSVRDCPNVIIYELWYRTTRPPRKVPTGVRVWV